MSRVSFWPVAAIVAACPAYLLTLLRIPWQVQATGGGQAAGFLPSSQLPACPRGPGTFPTKPPHSL